MTEDYHDNNKDNKDKNDDNDAFGHFNDIRFVAVVVIWPLITNTAINWWLVGVIMSMMTLPAI